MASTYEIQAALRDDIESRHCACYGESDFELDYIFDCYNESVEEVMSMSITFYNLSCSYYSIDI